MDRLMVPVLAVWPCVAAGIESADAASGQESVVLPSTTVPVPRWPDREYHTGVSELRRIEVVKLSWKEDV